jgi:hypothetical protein
MAQELQRILKESRVYPEEGPSGVRQQYAEFLSAISKKTSCRFNKLSKNRNVGLSGGF